MDSPVRLIATEHERVREALVAASLLCVSGEVGVGKTYLLRSWARTSGSVRWIDASAGLPPLERVHSQTLVLDHVDGQDVRPWIEGSARCIVVSRRAIRVPGALQILVERAPPEVMAAWLTMHGGSAAHAEFLAERLDGNALLAEIAGSLSRVLAPREVLARLEAREPLGVLLGRDALRRTAHLDGALEGLGASALDLLSLLAASDRPVPFPTLRRLCGAEVEGLVLELLDARLARSEDGAIGLPMLVRRALFGLFGDRLTEGPALVAAELSEKFVQQGCVGMSSAMLSGELSEGMLRAAYAHARAAASDPAWARRALFLGAALSYHLRSTEPFAALAVLDALLSTLDHADEQGRAFVIDARIRVLLHCGEPTRARAMFEAHREMLERCLPRALAAHLHSYLLWSAGDPAASAEVGEVGLAAVEGRSPALEALLAGALGAAALDRADLVRGRSYCARAAALFRQAGDQRGVAINLSNLGCAAVYDLDLSGAAQLFEEARDTAIAMGDTLNETIALHNIACVALERGLFAEASARLAEGLALARSARLLREIQTLGVTYALCRREAGDVTTAWLAIEEAISAADGTGRTFRFAQGIRALLAADGGDGALAEVCLALGRPEKGDLVEEDVLGLLGAAVDVRIHGGAAHARAEATLARVGPGALFTEGRCAMRAVIALCARSPREVEVGGAERLVIARDGRAFRVPFGAPVTLKRRRHLAGILIALGQARGGAPLDVWAVATAGWPDEKMSSASASKRAYTALWTLRTLGLRDLLVHDGRGYALSSSVPFAWVDELDASHPAKETKRARR